MTPHTLYTGTVMHARRTPAENVFRYRVAYFGLDVDRLDELNRLQRLSEDEEYCVTLNRGREIDEARVIARFDYTHPQYTFTSLAAQSELPLLNGPNRTAFAGAWQGFGFHEDGLESGQRAAEAICA